MDRGLYIAASGMLAELARQDQIANDLANASTPGYKSNRVQAESFGDALLSNTATGQVVGPMGMGSRVTGQVVDLTAAPLKQTDEPLDLAVEGDGFFSVQTPQGVRFTRNGQFRSDAQSRLVDQQGNPVLGANGQPVRVSADGKVDPKAVGVTVLGNVRNAGDAYYTGTAQRGATAGTVRTGALEGSGVDPARTIVEMIGSLRAFEAGQKAITTIDETLRQASSQVGTLS